MYLVLEFYYIYCIFYFIEKFLLIFFRLTGSKPFNTKNYNEVLNENKRFHFNKSDNRYSFMSNEGQIIIKYMLNFYF